MYYIGPLLFWACAEMTCGFFILSVPCLPKIAKESSLPRAIKRALGLSVKSTTGPSNGTPSGSGSHHLSRPSKSGIAAADSYYKIREDGVMLGDVERSESQEGLRGEYERGEAAKGGAVRVTRTTHISVTTDAQSVSDLEDNAAPWTRRVSHT